MIICSTTHLPAIDRAGRFPCVNPTFDFIYRNPTCAIHLYDYDVTLDVEGERFELRPGELTCIQAGHSYAYSTKTPGKHWCIHFNDPVGRQDAGVSLPTHIRLGQDTLAVERQFRTISQLQNTPVINAEHRTLARLEAKARLKALIFNLCTLSDLIEQNHAAKDFIDWHKLSALMDKTLGHNLTTKHLAAQFDVSPRLFAQKFKEKYHCTFKQHLLRRRIETAENLLSNSDLSIFEIGASVGIPDPQYFNKQFRRVTGISPSQFRKKNRKAQEQLSHTLALKEGSWQR